MKSQKWTRRRRGGASSSPLGGSRSLSPRIAFLTRHLGRDGAPWLTDDLIAALERAGASVEVFHYDIALEKASTRGDHYWHSRPLRSREGFLSRVGFLIRHVRTILEILVRLTRRRPDYVISYTSLSLFWPVVPVLRVLNVRCVGLIWDFYPEQYIQAGMMRSGSLYARGFRLVEDWEFRARDELICMTPANIEYLKELHPQVSANISAHYLWKDLASFENVRADYDPSGLPTGRLVVFGGTMSPGRDFGAVLEAAEILEGRGSDAKIVFVGGGRRVDEVARSARDRGLRNVIFIERLPVGQYLGLLQHAKVGLVTLSDEVASPSFPSKILDYMYSELPVVVSCRPDNDVGRIVEEEFRCGFACSAGAGPDMAAAIEKALQNPTLGKAGRRVLEGILTPDRVASEILK